MRGLPLTILFISLFSGWSEAQTIADIARQERARKQTAQTRIKVTNESVDYGRPAAAVPEPAPEPSPILELPLHDNERASIAVPPLAAPPPTAIIPFLVIDDPSVPQISKSTKLSLLEQEAPSVAAPLAPVRDERWWRTAFQEARSHLKEAEDREILLEVRLSRARLDQLELTSTTQRTSAAADVTRLTKEVDRVQKDVANARKSVNELEDELRESGGLSSWAR